MEEVKERYLKVKEAVVETVRRVSRSLSPSRAGSPRAKSPSRSRDGRAEAQSPSHSRHSRAEAVLSSQSGDERVETRSLSPSGRDVKGAWLKAISSAIGSDSVAECLLECVPIPGITLALKGLVVIFDAAAALHYNKQLALELSDYMRKVVAAINDKQLTDVYAESKEKLENDVKKSTDEMTKFLAEFKKLLVDVQEALLGIKKQSVIEQMINYKQNELQLEKLLERIKTEINLVLFGTLKWVADGQTAIKKDLESLAADITSLQENITDVLKIAIKSAQQISNIEDAQQQTSKNIRMLQDALNEFRDDIGSEFHSDGDREFLHSMRNEVYPDLTTWTPTQKVLENAFKKLVQGNLVQAQTLNLEKKGINDSGVKALADAIEALQPQWKITNLYIGGNLFTSEGVKALAHSLVNCTTFEILHLSGSKNINDDCAASLAELLEKGKGNLKKLHLAGCNISDAGVESLSKGLRKNKTLIHLSLYDNHRITSKGAKYLAQAIENNGSLTQLNLRGGQIDFEGVKELAKVFLRDKELDTLNLDLNVLSLANYKELEHMVDEDEYKVHKNTIERKSVFWVSYKDNEVSLDTRSLLVVAVLAVLMSWTIARYSLLTRYSRLPIPTAIKHVDAPVDLHPLLLSPPQDMDDDDIDVDRPQSPRALHSQHSFTSHVSLNSHSNLPPPRLPIPLTLSLSSSESSTGAATSPFYHHDLLAAFLSSIKVFGYLDRNVFHELASSLSSRSLNSGAVLLRPHDVSSDFFIVVEGAVQVYSAPDATMGGDGPRVVSGVGDRGDEFGGPTFVDRGIFGGTLAGSGSSGPHGLWTATGGSGSHAYWSGTGGSGGTVPGDFQLLHEVRPGASVTSLFWILDVFAESVSLPEDGIARVDMAGCELQQCTTAPKPTPPVELEGDLATSDNGAGTCSSAVCIPPAHEGISLVAATPPGIRVGETETTAVGANVSGADITVQNVPVVDGASVDQGIPILRGSSSSHEPTLLERAQTQTQTHTQSEGASPTIYQRTLRETSSPLSSTRFHLPPITALASTPTILAVLPRKAFTDIRRKYPRAAGHVAGVILARFARVVMGGVGRWVGYSLVIVPDIYWKMHHKGEKDDLENVEGKITVTGILEVLSERV
ncbi:Neuropathy target esterase [Gonapodya sp. JEL0774]|nr:Neuropathy target esterase [Gonapodya sp. JEL0774]